LRLALSEGPNRVDVSFPSPEDGNENIFRNVVFSSYLDPRRWTKTRNPVILCYTHCRTILNLSMHLAYLDFSVAIEIFIENRAFNIFQWLQPQITAAMNCLRLEFEG
jgi:hypothetical protein